MTQLQANVLIRILDSGQPKAMLYGFGSSDYTDGQVRNIFNPLILREDYHAWIAPELMVDSDLRAADSQPRATIAADMYAFGCLCFEVRRSLSSNVIFRH